MTKHRNDGKAPDSNLDEHPDDCGLTRRRFTRTAAMAGAAAVAAPYVLTRPVRAADKSLTILQWSHFVPSYDTWFDAYAKSWGEKNGVNVSVDHIGIADLTSTAAAEISAGSGHDMIELGSQASQFEPSLIDLADVNAESDKDFGPPFYVADRVSYNPFTKKHYAFCHGWTIDACDYRKSLWAKAGMPAGPGTWQELADVGGQIKQQQGVQVGIGMSQEIDSNMAARAVLWSFGSAVQNEFGEVILDQPTFYRRSVEAAKYMKELSDKALTPEVFSWNAASNNQALIAGRASFILNSISAYRSAQEARPDIAKDVFFSAPLFGPNHTRWGNVHILYNYIVPKYSQNVDAAKMFMKDLAANYDQAMYHSKLYNSPSHFDTPVPQGDRGYPAVTGAKTLRGLFDAWFENDPFRLPGEAEGKLRPLKEAEQWTTNVGHPGYANPAIGEVFNTFVLPNMMARAARGEESPEDSVKRAAKQCHDIFARWRERGLIGGSAG